MRYKVVYDQPFPYRGKTYQPGELFSSRGWVSSDLEAAVASGLIEPVSEKRPTRPKQKQEVEKEASNGEANS